MSYFISQLLPFKQNNNGFLIMMSTGNLDESLTGYFTKYDSSSGDLNLIGALNKEDIRACMTFLYEKYEAKIIKDVLEAKPSAELKTL